MFIYNGKFTWADKAVNQTITIVFPAGFAVNDPVSVFFQWSKDPITQDTGSSASNAGVISASTQPDSSTARIHFSFGDYGFDADVDSDYDELSLTARSYVGGCGSGHYDKLKAVHMNLTNIRSVVVYTGRLQWGQSAQNEMVTIVLPYGVAEGAFFGLFHQWTTSPPGDGKPGPNDRFIGPLTNVVFHAPDDAPSYVTASCCCSKTNYKCSLMFSGDMKGGSLTLSTPSNLTSNVTKFSFSYGL